MNARLMKTAPESLQRQAETYSATCLLLLETSSRYFDLHVASLRTSLERLRESVAVAAQLEGSAAFQHYSAAVTQSLADTGQYVRQSGALAAETQRQFGSLIEAGWQQSKHLFQQAAEEQLAISRGIAAAIAEGGVSR